MSWFCALLHVQVAIAVHLRERKHAGDNVFGECNIFGPAHGDGQHATFSQADWQQILSTVPSSYFSISGVMPRSCEFRQREREACIHKDTPTRLREHRDFPVVSPLATDRLMIAASHVHRPVTTDACKEFSSIRRSCCTHAHASLLCTTGDHCTNTANTTPTTPTVVTKE